MAEIDPSHILFPSDAPAKPSAPAAPEVRSPTITPLWKTKDHTAAGGDDAAQPTEDVAAKLFGTERQTDHDGADLYGSIEKLDGLADAARMSGDDDRASALMEAGTALVEDARAHGTSAGDLREIVGLIHEASATVSEMTADQLSEGKARSLSELSSSGVTDADIDLARGLIRQMGEKVPNLNRQLEATGLGNDVRFIQAVIKEAKRRRGF